MSASLWRPSLCNAAVVWALLAGCGGGGEPGTESPTQTAAPSTPTASPTPAPTPVPGPNLAGPYPYELLSEYHFFREPLSELEPVPGVHPYEVASPLWTDGAGKSRLLVLPEGAAIEFQPEEDWSYPVGAILIKNFWVAARQGESSGPRTLMETRLLIHEEDGWTAHTYVWNAEQTDAVRTVAGKIVQVPYQDNSGAAAEQTYVIPNTNQCNDCHVNADAMLPLGVVTRQLNRLVEVDGQQVNQLEWLASLGVFSSSLPATASLPALVNPLSEGELEPRARSYLDANCAHCHRIGGGAENSGLWLEASITDPLTYGVCKKPVAAGSGSGAYYYDIVPGYPDESIVVFRMESTEPDIRMPEFGVLYPDSHGIAVIREWITAMEPKGCEGAAEPTQAP